MCARQKFLMVLCGLVLATGTQTASALEGVPSRSGLSGKLGLGAAYTDAETNLVKGSSLWDIGKAGISTVTQTPKAEDDTWLYPRGQIAYTFADQKLQLFIASDVEEIVDLETVQQIGIKKQFDTLGIVSLGYVTSGLLAQEVWADPYAVGSRSDTDREFGGVRLVWDRIAGLPVEFFFQYRDISIDDENSGQALGLSAAQQAQLDREGDDYRAELRYNWRPSSNEIFSPYVGYVDADRDGDAVKYTGVYVGLDAAYRNDTWGVAGRARVGNKDRDARNPVYGRRTDSDWYEIAVRGDYRLPWGTNWFATGAVAWAVDNNDVRFHDQQNLLFTVGAEWRFGQSK
jgi:hypothetical protein